MKLPETYEKKMRRLLGEDYEEYLSSFNKKYGQTFRINPLKKAPAEFLRRLAARSVPWCEGGYYCEKEERLSLHPYYHGGVYYLQEPCAMAPASFLPVKPGDRVLDLCAAPGGKTTALAGKLGGRGVIVANDISISRCKALLKNMEMAGVRNGMILCESSEKLCRVFAGYFDSILVDAPCSGEGMFRKEPSMAERWSEEAVEEYSRIQKELLRQAACMVKPGGYLLYSTCTYSPEENEQVVETLLEEEGAFSLLELPLFSGVDEGHPEWSLSGREALKRCRRFWNHKVEGEGQFAALLQKTGGEEEKMADEEEEKEEKAFLPRRKKKKGERKAPEKKEERLPREMEAFLQDCGLPLQKQNLIQRIEERAFLLPDGLPSLEGLRVVRSGLYLGDCKKKRFEPSQALAQALCVSQYGNTVKLSAQDERVERYLRCETIEAPGEDGWVLVCVDDYPLGWGKRTGGVIKNKYAPGWRKQ